MCEYCGCRGVAPIAELMDEHVALVEQASHVRHDLATGDRASALDRLRVLVADLERHVGREEDGVFRALRDAGEFLDESDLLEGEHRGFAALVAGLDLDSPQLLETLTRLLDDLADHVEREDLGIFPVSVVTLGADGWETVDRAHAESPSFLLDPSHP